MAKAFINSLNPEAVAYLNDSENVAVHKISHRASLAMVVAGLGIAGLAGFLTFDYRWSSIKLVLFALLALCSSYLLIAGIRKWLLNRARPFASGLIVTREHSVFVADEEIEWFPLVDLVNVDYRHQFNGRKYEFSTVTVNIPNQERKYRVDGIDLAEWTVDEIEERKKQCLIRANRSEYGGAGSVLDTIPTTKRTFRFGSLISTLLPALALATIGTFGALFLNEYFHDHLSCRKAVDTDSAASYREYLRNNLKGRRAGGLRAGLRHFTTTLKPTTKHH